MKRILLFIDRNQSPDKDIFIKTDYNTICSELKSKGGNSGNKVWLSAVEQYLSQKNSEYNYYQDGMNADIINDEYDMIVFPCDNRLRNDDAAKSELRKLSALFRQIKIPVYIVGIGAQSSSYDGIDELATGLKDYLKEFTEAISSTGGDIAVRGHFTQELLKNCGYNEATIIGCPSLYRKGRNLKIIKNCNSVFKPVLNIKQSGYDLLNIRKEIRNNPLCESIDQNRFYKFLYDATFLESACNQNSIQFLITLAKYPSEALYMMSQNRLKLFFDVPIWQEYLEDSKFSFSYGSRIHGSIMTLLAGIPTMLFDCDSRTKEIAEYFSIPIDPDKRHKTNLSELLENADYTQFNKNFGDKYDIFEKYINDREISTDIQNHSVYDKKVEEIGYNYPPQINSDTLKCLSTRIEEYSQIIPITRLVRYMRRIF